MIVQTSIFARFDVIKKPLIKVAFLLPVISNSPDFGGFKPIEIDKIRISNSVDFDRVKITSLLVSSQ
jgi:hypothetical protein